MKKKEAEVLVSSLYSILVSSIDTLAEVKVTAIMVSACVRVVKRSGITADRNTLSNFVKGLSAYALNQLYSVIKNRRDLFVTQIAIE